MAFLLDGRIGEQHVFRLNRRAVVKTRLLAKLERATAAIFRKRRTFRDQAVDRIRLVQRRSHQRIKGQFHARRRITLEREGIERVERVGILVPDPARRREIERAALRCFGTGIVEMGEIGTVFQVTESRKPMQRFACRDVGKGPWRQEGCNGGTSRKPQKMAAVHAKDCHSRSALIHCRF